MASAKLTPDQQDINNILKAKGYQTFTASEYQKDLLANTLLQKYQQRKNQLFGQSNFELYIYTKMKHKKLATSKIDIQTELEKLAVRTLFGLTNEALIEKIMCPDYSEYSEQDEEGNFFFDSKLQQKVALWIQYCEDLDLCLKQYKQDEPQWSKSAQAKKDYKQYWLDLAKQPLFKTPQSNILHKYHEFLKANYGLNQSVKAKANFLLSQQLPNIENFEIAKQIVETSSLLR